MRSYLAMFRGRNKAIDYYQLETGDILKHDYNFGLKTKRRVVKVPKSMCGCRNVLNIADRNKKE